MANKINLDYLKTKLKKENFSNNTIEGFDNKDTNNKVKNRSEEHTSELQSH